MKKVIVTDIDNYYYTLNDGDNNYIINIEFYTDNKLNINDIVYLSEEMLNSKFLSFCDLHSKLNLTTDDIIKVVSNNNIYYLEREYG